MNSSSSPLSLDGLGDEGAKVGSSDLGSGVTDDISDLSQIFEIPGGESG